MFDAQLFFMDLRRMYHELPKAFLYYTHQSAQTKIFRTVPLKESRINCLDSRLMASTRF